MKLSKCEQEVMSVIYNLDKTVNFNEIWQAVNTQLTKKWKLQTVSTFVARLVKKGYLLATPISTSGKRNMYTTAISREAYQKELLLDLCAVSFNNNIENLKAIVSTL